MVDSINGTNSQNKITEKQYDEQIELEEWSLGYGAEIATSGKWQKGATGYMEKTYMPAYQQACLKMWEDSQCKAQMYGAEMAMLGSKKAVMQVAGETLSYLLNEAEENVYRTKLINDMGKIAEQTLFIMYLNQKIPGHIKSLRRLSGRNLALKEMQNRLRHRGFREARGYKAMDNSQRQKLGLCLLEIARIVTKLFSWKTVRVSQKKQKLQIEFADSYWKFLGNYKRCLETLRPHLVPMIVPPKPWTMNNCGGYYKIQSSLIKSMGTEQVKDALEISQPCVLSSQNILQHQGYFFNHFIMDTEWQTYQLNHSVGKLPPKERLERPDNSKYKDVEGGGTQYWTDKYRYEHDQLKNGDRSRFMRNRIVYEKLKNKKLYFPWEKDFRGRAYMVGSSVNYQLNDAYRSQLLFDQGSVLRNHLKEVWWAFGDAAGLSKSWQSREVFYRGNLPQILKAGMDPLGSIAFWEGRKEPWRFLALCREVYLAHQDPCHETCLPFALDQTNSNYGHLAALTRDHQLALQTNLIGSEYSDLYESFKVWLEDAVERDHVMDQSNVHAEWWRFNGKVEISRELMKKAIMPVVFSRSHLTLIEVIREHIEQVYLNFLVDDGNGGKLKTGILAKYLASKVSEAVKVKMPGIHDLDRWLKQYVACFDQDEYPGFTSPNDLWINVGKKAHYMKSCHLVLSGKRITFMAREERDEVDLKRSQVGLAPNFLHMLDASFLERFVHHWHYCYRHPIVTVHDCFATTLDSVSLMRKELCDQFNRFYSEDHSFKPVMTAIAKIKRRDENRLPSFPLVDDLALTEIGTNPFLFC